MRWVGLVAQLPEGNEYYYWFYLILKFLELIYALA